MRSFKPCKLQWPQRPQTGLGRLVDGSGGNRCKAADAKSKAEPGQVISLPPSCNSSSLKVLRENQNPIRLFLSAGIFPKSSVCTELRFLTSARPIATLARVLNSRTENFPTT